MPKFVVCLITVFSLLIAPIASATGSDCLDSKCSAIEQSSKVNADTDKNDDGKSADLDHNCCCSHVSAKMNSLKTYTSLSTEQSIFAQDDRMSSIVLGPPLEPPSHV